MFTQAGVFELNSYSSYLYNIERDHGANNISSQHPALFDSIRGTRV